jgi:hypothetical protein
MRTPDAEARRWLRWDAAYCGGAGLVMLVLAAPLGRLFHLPGSAVAALGAATIVWALLLLRLTLSADWRPQLRRVATVNAAASIGVAVLAAVAPALAARLLLVAVAVEVAAFAFAQVRVLSRG